MHTGKLLFAQLMEHLPPMVFERCVARYGGHHKVKSFSCMDQFPPPCQCDVRHLISII